MSDSDSYTDYYTVEVVTHRRNSIDFDYCLKCYRDPPPVQLSDDVMPHQPGHRFLAVEKEVPPNTVQTIIAGINSKNVCLKALAHHCFSDSVLDVESLVQDLSTYLRLLMDAPGEEDGLPQSLRTSRDPRACSQSPRPRTDS